MRNKRDIQVIDEETSMVEVEGGNTQLPQLEINQNYMLNVDKEIKQSHSKTSNSSHVFHSTTFGPPLDPKIKFEIHNLLDIASEHSLSKTSSNRRSPGQQMAVQKVANFLQADGNGVVELKLSIEPDHFGHAQQKMFRDSSFTNNSHSILTEQSLKSIQNQQNQSNLLEYSENQLIEISVLSNQLSKNEAINFDTITKKVQLNHLVSNQSAFTEEEIKVPLINLSQEQNQQTEETPQTGTQSQLDLRLSRVRMLNLNSSDTYSSDLSRFEKQKLQITESKRIRQESDTVSPRNALNVRQQKQRRNSALYDRRAKTPKANNNLDESFYKIAQKIPFFQIVNRNGLEHKQMQGYLIVPNLVSKSNSKQLQHSEESNSKLSRQNDNDHKSLTSSRNHFQRQVNKIQKEINNIQNIYLNLLEPRYVQVAADVTDNQKNFFKHNYDFRSIIEANEELEMSSVGGNQFFQNFVSHQRPASFSLQFRRNSRKQTVPINLQRLQCHSEKKCSDGESVKKSGESFGKRISNPDPASRFVQIQTCISQGSNLNSQSALLPTMKKRFSGERTHDINEEQNEENYALSLQQAFKTQQSEKSIQKLQSNGVQEILEQDCNSIQEFQVLTHSMESQSKTQQSMLIPSPMNQKNNSAEPKFQSPHLSYMYSNGSKNFKGKNLIKAVRRFSNLRSKTPDLNPQHMANILDLTKKKALLQHIESELPTKQEAIDKLKQITGKRLQDLTNLLIQKNKKKKDQGLRLSFETNVISNQMPQVDPINFNWLQDDFTPSNCMHGRISNSSDLQSSANVHLSQIEPFNPEHYDMEIIPSNSSQIHRQAGMVSMQESGYSPINSAFSQRMNDKIKKIQSCAMFPIPENFTQQMIQKQFFPKGKIINEVEKIDAPQNMKGPVLSGRINKPEENVHWKLLRRSFTPNIKSQDNELLYNNLTVSSLKLPSKDQVTNNESNDKKMINFKLKLEEDQIDENFYLSKPLRQTSTIYESDTQNDDSILHQTQKTDQQVQLHPDLMKLISKESQDNLIKALLDREKKRLKQHHPDNRLEQESTISRNTASNHEIVQVMTIRGQKILIYMQDHVQTRVQKEIQAATDSLYAQRRQKANNQTQQVPKIQKHSTITTTSCKSSNYQGQKRINQYQMIQEIGQGKFSKVKLCVDINTNRYYAAKIMDKQKLRRKTMSKDRNAFGNVSQEMAIMKKLDHPNILKLFEIIDDPNQKKLYLITEFVKNGNLVKRINQDKDNFFTNPDYPPMRKYFRQLIEALDYCHNVVKIIHRDIKPENILIDQNDDIKLADFGVSSFESLDLGDKVNNNAGSAIFFSPEACIGNQYRGRLNDIWACGITLYFMATGKYPFNCKGNDYQKLFKMIQNNQPKFPSHLEGSNLQDLILKLLMKVPEDRITIEQIKRHPWITCNCTEPPIPQLDPNLLDFVQPSQEDVQNTMTQVKTQIVCLIKKKTNLSDVQSAI